MENATLLTYLAATMMDHRTNTTTFAPPSSIKPHQTPNPPGVTIRASRPLHPMHSAGYNRQSAKRSGDVLVGGPHRVSVTRGGGGSGTKSTDNGLDRPITGAIVIGSIFLFITMSITAAILVFCKKKNTVFIFGAGNKNDDMYADTSVNLNPDDLLDDNSDDDDDDYDDDDESPSSERRRQNEAVALDPRLLRDPRGLELIALTSGRHDLNLLYRDLLRYQRASNFPPVAPASAEESDYDSGDVERGQVAQQRRVPAYRVSATSKYLRMQCSAVVENHTEEPPNSQTLNRLPDETWMSLDNLEKRADPQKLGAGAIAAAVRDDVICNPRVKIKGPTALYDRSVDMTDPSFFVNPHFKHTDPPVEETQFGSSPAHRPWHQKSEKSVMDFTKDLNSLHVTLVSDSGHRVVCLKPKQPPEAESGEEESEKKTLLESQVAEEDEEEEKEAVDDNLNSDRALAQGLLENSPNSKNTESRSEDQQMEVNEPLLAE